MGITFGFQNLANKWTSGVDKLTKPFQYKPKSPGVNPNADTLYQNNPNLAMQRGFTGREMPQAQYASAASHSPLPEVPKQGMFYYPQQPQTALNRLMVSRSSSQPFGVGPEDTYTASEAIHQTGYIDPQTSINGRFYQGQGSNFAGNPLNRFEDQPLQVANNDLRKYIRY